MPYRPVGQLVYKKGLFYCTLPYFPNKKTSEQQASIATKVSSFNAALIKGLPFLLYEPFNHSPKAFSCYKCTEFIIK